MSDKQLAFASIAEIAKLYRARKLSPVELTRLQLERIERINPTVNAYITVCAESALKQAARAEADLCAKSPRNRRDLGLLHGIPISLKDNICTKDVRTTGGSQVLRDFIPLHDASVVLALKKAGAVILGKTNLHEFAYGVTTDNPHFGAARNPWDLERTPGGSSGGSAAALAAGLCYGSIGTDTGGSIRIPASLCGVVGLKPGLGRVRTDGVIPLSVTLDFVGPLARTVNDASLLLEAIFVRGKNEGKPRAATGNRPLRLGIPKEFFLDVIDDAVEAAFESAMKLLKKRGTKFKIVRVGRLAETEHAGNQIAWAEATLYHQQAGWFPARAAEYGADVRSRLEMGTKVTAVDYLKARETREKFISEFHAALEQNDIDALVAPTTPIPAPHIGEESVTVRGEKHPTRALLLRLNRPANLAGVPAITVPCGLTRQGLPVGVQLMAGWTRELLLLELARAFERECPLNARPALDELASA
jgi:aspartyl-tRNA(Asn)/glutamyl-tRNA(Gln) amidotransferase subunit A